MHSPDWIKRAYYRAKPLPWYRTLYIRMIIDPVDFLCTWWYWKVVNRWYNLQNAIMRVRKGHDWVDVWNMNDWFISNAVQILEHWIENGIGSPVMDDEDGNEMTHEKWISILTEMLEGFKLYKLYEQDAGNKEEPDIYDSGTMHTGSSMLDNSGKYSSCYVDGAHYMTFDGTWYKMSMSKTDDIKFQRSLDLFKKYFYTLWD